MRLWPARFRSDFPDSCPRFAPPAFIQRRRAAQMLGAFLAAASLAGCVTMDSVSRRVSDSPQHVWRPPAEVQPSPALAPSAAASAAVQIPPDFLAGRKNWTLADLVDIGLSNSPLTRLAWGAARSAAAALGSVQSVGFPRVDIAATGSKTKAAFAGGRFIVDQTTLTPVATLSYLLLDFGGRKAITDAARRALEAANWMQNAAIQNVILQVERSYYQYIAAKALLNAQEASRKSARASWEAASERLRAGVATIADVLQAKTALSSTELNLVTAQGLVQTLHGTLANALGLAADADFEVPDGLDGGVPHAEFSQKVEECIKDAEVRRPDLAAARATALRAEAQIRKAQSDRLPMFTLNGSFGRIYYEGRSTTNDQFGLSVLLNIPIFAGFQRDYQILQARADAETAALQARKLEQDIALQVWTSYYGVKTAEQKIKSSQDLLTSATQSYDVALGRYKEGVGSILDVLTAQSLLENARGLAIQAKTEWLLSLVQFARDSGVLAAPGSAASSVQ